ncbi:MAG: acylphosphatase [Phycisphaerae bacterium]|jgi:acylphosphatase
MAETAKHIFFAGHVQGVGFRFTAQSVAKRYELTGFVRNNHDGKVEMLVQGQKEDIEDCLHDLQETFAINDFESDDIAPDPAYIDFRIKF